MKELSIKIDTINDVKIFVNTVSRFEYDVDIISGRYAIDAKSIMGLFSIDLSKAVTMRVHSDDCDDLLAEIKQFTV
ncbi:MAG: HPr family phosphocarrier protein [Oscillospiraceae bacterium]|nr:HPr family phosphocarrier protein [Oscillospiraceae bacterium]